MPVKTASLPTIAASLLTNAVTLLVAIACLSTPSHTVSAQSPNRTMYVCMYRAPQSMPGTMATPSFQGLAISMDRGHSWYNRGWKTSMSNSIVRHPENEELLLLANDYGVLRSLDNGISWKQMTGWDFPTPLSLTMAGDRCWAATSEGPYVSDDRGDTWKFSGTGLPEIDGQYIAQIIAAPGNGASSNADSSSYTLFAATADGVWRSDDDGAEWHTVGLRGSGIDRIAVHPSNPNLLAALNGTGEFWLSTDAGKSWSDRSKGMPSRILQCMAFDPRGEETVIVGTADMGLLRTSDLGATWSIEAGGLTNFYITAVTFDPDLKDVVFAGADSGIFVSEDNGSTWHPFSIRKGYVSEIKIY